MMNQPGKRLRGQLKGRFARHARQNDRGGAPGPATRLDGIGDASACCLKRLPWLSEQLPWALVSKVGASAADGFTYAGHSKTSRADFNCTNPLREGLFLLALARSCTDCPQARCALTVGPISTARSKTPNVRYVEWNGLSVKCIATSQFWTPKRKSEECASWSCPIPAIHPCQISDVFIPRIGWPRGSISPGSRAT